MFEVKNLSEEKSIVCQILKELRDKEIQQDRYRFRKNIERIGMIAAYEISKSGGNTGHTRAWPDNSGVPYAWSSHSATATMVVVPNFNFCNCSLFQICACSQPEHITISSIHAQTAN